MTPFMDSLVRPAEADCGTATLKQDSRAMAWPGEMFARWRERIESACGAFECVTLSYLTILNVLIMIFFRSIPHPQRYIAAHQCVALGILLVVGNRRPRAVCRFVRCWYPLPLYIGFFEELRGLVHLVFPGWFDASLLRFDFWLCAAQPAMWMSQFARPALDDFMQFSYMTYFVYLVLLPALLYARRETRAFWTVMTCTALAHYTVYLIAVVFPIESPHFSLAHMPTPLAPLTGGFSTSLIGVIETYGRVHGAAFPSAHVAGSMVAILCAWRYRRWLFWVTLPFFVSMMVATVYGRYHYVADVLAGMLVGAAGYAAGLKVMRQPGAVPVDVVATTAEIPERIGGSLRIDRVWTSRRKVPCEGQVGGYPHASRCYESCGVTKLQRQQRGRTPDDPDVVARNHNG
jgi:membrane-associated phospholipid phosphatase